MSGKVPPSSRASKSGAAFRDAANLYERFTGHRAVEIGRAMVPNIPREVAVIGELDFLGYTTVRDGNVEPYIHRFRKSDKPLFCVSPDGMQILLIGGRYVFTERGIVDYTDKANLPRWARDLTGK